MRVPLLADWLSDTNPNVRRAVSEGLRVWTSRPYFKDNPAVAINLLSTRKNDNSEYVRKSIGNALKDKCILSHQHICRDEHHCVLESLLIYVSPLLNSPFHMGELSPYPRLIKR